MVKGALNNDLSYKEIVIAGPRPISWNKFIKILAEINGLKVRVFSVPVRLLLILSFFMKILPFLPKVTKDEILRLVEDKAFSLEDAETYLKFKPTSYQESLTQLSNEI